MKKIAFACSAALGALLLSACSGSGDAGSSGEAAEVNALKPGLWELTTTVPNTPKPLTTKVCIGEAVPGSNSFAPPATGDCAKNELTKTADGLALDMECTNSGMTTTTKGTITGDMTSTYKVEMTTKTSGPNMPAAAQVEISSTVEGKYLGDCPADMKPGQAQS
ncbi:DUF3617 domain-containing protein [Altererythrobacter sp. Root672]|uniref:DUF3617 domain-containing protein n=1 Tax=Altererythrobacter sp. Root672 TaxID=1736584 RepID=UPI0006F9A364|nr:DUF3617 family protein [Altererythrobacter sp. Root672]KRA84408.1 hypothetical protein ASD76_10660 [Altererythrobacter sp. Root672]